VLLDLTKLSGVLGDKTAKAFLKQFGFETVSDLLEHYPRRYASRGELTGLNELPIGEQVSVVGEIERTAVKHLKGRSGSIFEVTLGDGYGQLSLTFFNQPWRQKELAAGKRGLFSGKVTAFHGKLQLAHPDYELFEELDEDQAQAWAELPIPIYKSSGPLTTWKIQKCVAIALDAFQAQELLPAGLLAKENLITLNEAVRKVHTPLTPEDWKFARDSLRFHEAVVLQSQVEKQRLEQGQLASAQRSEGELVASFDRILPFTLTSGQKQVSQQLSKDLFSGNPMHRLLQGEVGSGKTVLALRAALTVADSGGQAALLAPTEVLASQHLSSIKKTLGPELSREVGLRLLTGSQGTKERKQTLLDLASGKCKLVVGTHALISDNVGFYDLGLVIIDEQHRFGVAQREKLRQKAKLAPHVLTMTATPIPRTVAITVFGDLDVSTLTELPAGRQEIKTHVVPVLNPALVARVWGRVKEEVDSGRQVFVVCPRIDGQGEEEELQEDNSAGVEPEAEESHLRAAAATEVFQALQQNKVLEGLRIGLMHGRLGSDEKSETMESFEQGDIDILVSTTVIEVGVNVPNASVMVVLDADRFGISQLHQLRGRVGRGEHSGLCLLVSSAEEGSLAMQRLEAVASTNDGFKLSEIDLELRGEGDVLGNLQSGGKSSLKLLRVIKDAELIERARGIAKDLFEDGLTAGLKQLLELQDAQALKQS
jgi:ATP-dependent DNA helicase RecG